MSAQAASIVAMTSGRLAISASLSFSFSSYFGGGGGGGLFDCAEARETKARDRTAAAVRLETQRVITLPLSTLTSSRNLMAHPFVASVVWNTRLRSSLVYSAQVSHFHLTRGALIPNTAQSSGTDALSGSAPGAPRADSCSLVHQRGTSPT